MRFDANNGYIVIGEFVNKEGKDDQTILIDGKSGTIVLNHTVTGGEEDFNTAQIWMAGYVLAAKTATSVTYPRISSSSSAANLSNITSGSTGSASGSPNSWYSYSGTQLASVMTIASMNHTVTTSDKVFNNVDIFQIISQTDSTGDYGVNLATGSADNIKTVAFYPVGCTEGYPVLGQAGALWNLYANEIDCVTLNNAGTIAAKMFVMDHETVATEPWVYEQLQGIWSALNTTNGGIGDVAGALGGLAGNVESQCVTGVIVQKTEPAAGMHGIAVDFYTGFNGVTRHTGTTEIYVASVDHSHNIEIDGTDLVLIHGVTTDKRKASLNHHHGISGSMSGNGTLTIDWESVNFPNATGQSTIDCSAWLVSKVHEIFKSSVSVTSTVTAYDGNESGTAYSSGSATLHYGGQQSTVKQDTDSPSSDTWSCTGDHGGYTKSNMANAWSKGWNACNSGNGRDENPYL